MERGRRFAANRNGDALPVTEQTGLPFASTVTTKDDAGNEVGVMHACGHDIHMASLVGTARIMAQLTNEWRGTLVLIGPTGRGARQRLPGDDRRWVVHAFSETWLVPGVS